jgi:hypothetical protein
VPRLLGARLRADLGHARVAAEDVPADVRERLDAEGGELEALAPKR